MTDPTLLPSAPIGPKFGAKSPSKLAVSITGELIQVRRDRLKVTV